MKQAKPLTREQYLKKFSRAVRWRLPPQESEEAIADYRELIFQPERDESKLVEELGDPVQATHLLTDVKAYRRWLAVFAVLAFCVIQPFLWVFLGWNICYDIPLLSFLQERWRPLPLLTVGLLLSLIWFRRWGRKSGTIPKGLIIALCAVLAAGIGTVADMWYVTGLKLDTHEFAWVDGMLTDRVTIIREAHVLLYVMMWVGLFAMTAGLIGLVLSRTRDRRWSALYLLTLTLLILLAVAGAHFNAMDFSIYYRDNVYDVRSVLFGDLIPVAIVGLIGTGVALC